MQGAPLTSDHGAPLRLVTPVKYGIKNIKRIGTIKFQDSRPLTTGPSKAMTGTRDCRRLFGCANLRPALSQ